MGLDWRNNNFAPESHFFGHFFAVTARLQHESVKFHLFWMTWTKGNSFFFFSWTSIPAFRIQLQKKCQHLKNWTKWNKRDKFWSSTTLLFKWRFCSRPRRRCSKLMLHGTICNNDFQRNTALRHCCNILLNDRNIVPILQRFIAQNIVVANRPM